SVEGSLEGALVFRGGADADVAVLLGDSRELGAVEVAAEDDVLGAEAVFRGPLDRLRDRLSCPLLAMPAVRLPADRVRVDIEPFPVTGHRRARCRHPLGDLRLRHGVPGRIPVNPGALTEVDI